MTPKDKGVVKHAPSRDRDRTEPKATAFNRDRDRDRYRDRDRDRDRTESMRPASMGLQRDNRKSVGRLINH